MTKKEDTDWKLVVIGLLLIAPATALRGYVLTQLWLWFIMPLGMPTLGLWHACGLSVLAGALVRDDTSSLVLRSLDKRGENEKMKQALLMCIIVPLIIWGFGAIFHALM